METTNAILNELRTSLADAYKKQLDGFGGMMKPKTKEILLDGFRDGVNSGISHTIKMLGITVKE